MSDLLDGQPATLDARLQRYHIIPFARNKVIIRRYAVLVPSEESSIAPLKRGEVLENAWRVINSTVGFEEGESGEGACAVIALEGDRAVLWISTADDSKPGVDLSMFEQIGQAEEVDIRRLISCPTHGNDLECLSAEKRCEVKWTCAPASQRAWTMFARGLVEKRAWKENRRISTASPFKCDLWPISTGKLLLKIHSSFVAEAPTTNTARSPYLSTVRLSPMGTPAIHVGDYDPTPAQESSLESSFSQTLGSSALPVGSSWGMDIDEHLGFGQPRWGVYWVCSDPKTPSQPTLEELEGKSGVMTIWPTHLTESTGMGGLTDDPVDVHQPLPTFDFPTTDSLLDVATALHDFYTAYNPPIVEPDSFDITPETDGPDHIDTQDDESKPIFSPSSPRQSEGDSEMDDLFGDHSPTPPAQSTLEDAVQGDVDDTMSLFEMPDLGGDIVMASPPGTDPEVVEEGITMSRPRRIEEETEGALITEDDFAFFDSPNYEIAGPAEEEEKMEQEKEVSDVGDEKHQVDTVEQTAANLVEPEVTEITGTTLRPHELATEVVDPTVDGTVNTAIVEENQLVRSIDQEPEVNDQSSSPTKTDDPPPRKTVTFEQIPLPPSPPSSVVDTVPSPFGPLAISPTIPSFSYALPSPAPSPETFPPLRTELVQRLASESKNKGKYDYASHWDIESEPSELDEEDDYTGAPPTPVSFVDTETLPSSITSPQTDSRNSANDLTWDGTNLIGSDLLTLRWDQEVLRQIGKLWKDAWAKGKLRNHQPEQAEKTRLPVTVECDRLVEEVISNRHLRDFLLDEGTTLQRSRADDGTSLNSFANVTFLKSLPPCQIHVGYSENVCELSVAAVRYWRQLGLQPVGGRKDISILIVCDTTQGDVRTAKGFLQRIIDSYEACMLGSCEIGTAAPAKDGIISIPPSAFVHAISGVLSNVAVNTVIFVMLPSTNPRLLSSLIEELLQSKRAGSDTSFTTLIPRSALGIHATQDILFEVYDRLCRPTQGISLRGAPTEPTVPYVQYPAFTLAPALPPKPDLVLTWPLRSYDVFNRWRIVHCAYGIDHKSEKAVGFVVDAQGEAWRSTVVALGEADVAGVVEALWGFFKNFAAIASVEYRLAICCVGDLTKTELDAWRALIDASKMPGSLIITPAQVSASPHPIHVPGAIIPIPPATFADPQTRIIDESLTGKVCSLPRLPIALSSSTEQIIPLCSFLLNMPTPPEYSTTKFDVIVHRYPSEQEDDPYDLFSEQLYRMVILGRTRHGLTEGVLPLHAEAVRIGLKSIRQVVSLP